MPAPTPSDAVLIALRRIIRATDLHSRNLLGRCGLTGPQALLLSKLSESTEASPGELAGELSLAAATVSGILDRLEARGFVTRSRSGTDRRRIVVSMTPEGRHAIEASPPLLQEHFLDRFADLETWEQHQLIASLERVVSMMQAADLDAAPIIAPGTLAAPAVETESPTR